MKLQTGPGKMCNMLNLPAKTKTSGAKHQRFFGMVVALGSLLAILLLRCPEAHAFSWGYSPYSTVSGLGYLARSVLYGSGFYRGYSPSGYWLNSLAWNGAYAVGQGFNSARSSSFSRPVPGSPIVDQIAAASWRYPQQPLIVQPSPPAQQSLPAQQAGLSEPGFDDQAFMPVPQPLLPNMPADLPPAQAPQLASAIAAEPPPLAPALDRPHHNPDKQSSKKQKESRRSAPLQPARTGSPFARALVDHINTSFNGDINAALKDKETARFAAALGLIDGYRQSSKIPADRVVLVQKILSDSSEDPEVKIQTVRMLLKH